MAAQAAPANLWDTNIGPYLRNTLNVNEDIATAFLDESGAETFRDLVTMSDERVVEILKQCRKLYVDEEEDPEAARRAAARNRAARERRRLADRGARADEEEDEEAARPGQVKLRVSDRVGMLIRKVAFYCFHQNRIDRLPGLVTSPILTRLWTWKELQENAAKLEATEPEPLTTEAAIRRTLEALDHYLLNKRGVEGTPLAYLTREHADPANAEDFNVLLPPITEELIRRARHGNYAAYDIDNKFLWSIIRKITENGFAWNWVSNQSRSQNGRAAYFQLRDHYLGPSVRNKIKSDADKVLDTAYYDGKSRNFSLESYCGKLMKAFADLEECGETVPEDKKVRTFLKGFRCPELLAAKHAIMASNTLLASVDAAMNYAKLSENSWESLKASSSRNVSSMKTGDKKFRGKGKGHDKGKGKKFQKKNPKTEYLPKEKWNALTPEQQQAMRDARDKAGIKRKVSALASDDDKAKKKTRFEEEESATVGVGDSMSRR